MIGCVEVVVGLRAIEVEALDGRLVLHLMKPGLVIIIMSVL